MQQPEQGGIKWNLVRLFGYAVKASEKNEYRGLDMQRTLYEKTRRDYRYPGVPVREYLFPQRIFLAVDPYIFYKSYVVPWAVSNSPLLPT